MSEDDSGRRVAQHRPNTLIGGATHQNRKRNCDLSRLQCAQKPDDVIESLWRHDDSAVTRRTAMF